MSQDAERPRSRKELRRHQGSAVSAAESATETGYPSVPLLPSSSALSEPAGLSMENPVEDKPASSRGRGAHSAAAQQTRQALKAEERARLAALLEQKLAVELAQDVPAVPQEPEQVQVVAEQIPPAAPVENSADASRARRVLALESDASNEQPVERRSQARARDRAALRAYREVAEDAKPAEPLPSRRLLRQQMLEAERAPITNAHQIVPALDQRSELSRRANEVSQPSQLSVTEALTARDQLVREQLAQNQGTVEHSQHQQAREQLLADALEHTGTIPPVQDPLKVDVELLAQQKELAERAAILNERAQARAKLAEESAGARQQLNDPTTAHNLAMVTPLQFVKIPGVERPVLKPPTTSHVPIVASAVSTTLPRPIRPPSFPPRGSSTDNSTGLVKRGSPAQVLRRAEEVALVRPRLAEPGALEADAEPVPMPANSAHGLEPLDAMTAGLGRIRRSRWWQWGIGLLGGCTLIAGLIMIISTMAR